jgi:hypothetical protein
VSTGSFTRSRRSAGCPFPVCRFPRNPRLAACVRGECREVRCSQGPATLLSAACGGDDGEERKMGRPVGACGGASALSTVASSRAGAGGDRLGLVATAASSGCSGLRSPSPQLANAPLTMSPHYVARTIVDGWGLSHCGREIAAKLANHRFSGYGRCASVGECANIGLRWDSRAGFRGCAAPRTGLGEWLTTAIHDAKPLNACPSLAAATVRLRPDRAPPPRRPAAARLRPSSAWRSSTLGGRASCLGQRPSLTIRRENSFRQPA